MSTHALRFWEEQLHSVCPFMPGLLLPFSDPDPCEPQGWTVPLRDSYPLHCFLGPLCYLQEGALPWPGTE